MRKLITLTTDFGMRDAYVAQMKGVLYAQGPSDLEVVDLSHELGAQQLFEAALFVRDAWPRFPSGTIHVVVVDPGVGSARRALVCSCAGQLMVGPDNGVMSLLAGAEAQLFVLDPERVAAAPLSATFHGRDLFAPVAAMLATGQDVTSTELPSDAPRGGADWPEDLARIVYIDRYGNAMTGWRAAKMGEKASVAAYRRQIPRARTFADEGGEKAASNDGPNSSAVHSGGPDAESSGRDRRRDGSRTRRNPAIGPRGCEPGRGSQEGRGRIGRLATS